jgi:hypothetical protein
MFSEDDQLDHTPAAGEPATAARQVMGFSAGAWKTGKKFDMRLIRQLGRGTISWLT